MAEVELKALMIKLSVMKKSFLTCSVKIMDKEVLYR